MYEKLFEMNLKRGEIVYNYSGIKEIIVANIGDSEIYLAKNNLYEGTRTIHRQSIFVNLKIMFLRSCLEIKRYGFR